MDNNRVLYKVEKQKQDKTAFKEELKKYNLPYCVSSFFDTVRSSSSQKLYWYVIKDFLEWKFDTINDLTLEQIKSINHTDLKLYIDNSVDSGNCGSSYINIKISALSSFSKHLYACEVKSKNMIDFLNLKSYKTKQKKIQSKMPTYSDLKAFEENLKGIKNPIKRVKYLTVFSIFKTIGLRLTELVGLDIEDVHFEGDYINGKYDKDYPYINVLRKGSYTESQMDKVYLPDKLANQIREWIAIRKLLKNSDTSSALFIVDGGRRISSNTIQNMFNKYSNGNITPHMLRHYAATIMIRETNDLALVQEQIGHTIGSDVTMGVYITGLEESKRKLKNI